MAKTKSRRWLTWLIPLVVITGFFGLMVSQMIAEGAVECRVCVTFKSQRQCMTGRGPTEEKAREEAHRSACSRMTNGVTEAFACPNQPADDVRCGRP